MNRESANDDEHLSQENQITWDKNLKKLGMAGVKKWLAANAANSENITDPNYKLWQTLSGALMHIETITDTFHQTFDWNVTPANIAEKAKTAFDAAKKATGR